MAEYGNLSQEAEDRISVVRFAPTQHNEDDIALKKLRVSTGSNESVQINPLISSSDNLEADTSPPQQQHTTSLNTSHPAETPSTRPSFRPSNDMPTTISTDGSLVSALAHSIKHHARLLDGEQQLPQPIKMRGVVTKAAYDSYQEDDDDHVSLAPQVEMMFEKEARSSTSRDGTYVTPAMRDYVANAAAGGGPTMKKDDIITAFEASGRSFDRENVDLVRRRLSISSWWRGSDRDEDENDAPSSFKSFRFAKEVALATAIANGGVIDEEDGNGKTSANPFAAWGVSGRAPSFVAPPPTSFRTATRHPSHFADGDQYDKLTSDNMRAARKRLRRNDAFLRLVIAILCFGVSLTFALYFGGGKFGLLMTNQAYERKVGTAALINQNSLNQYELEEVFYPAWWVDEEGIPDMSRKNIQLKPVMEYNAADVTKARAPGRIETPFLWLIPKSGANVIRTVLAACLKLGEASDMGKGSTENVCVVVCISLFYYLSACVCSRASCS